MKIGKFRDSNGSTWVGVVADDRVYRLRAGGSEAGLFQLLEAGEQALAAGCREALGGEPVRLDSLTSLAPIENQEVWGAGVTYLRSKQAREEESEQAASFYDRIYAAERPELFFKATPHRVVGPGQPVRVRADSRWSVPEPELALVLRSDLSLVGYTIGNDMSARDIEGSNPLYLPQAKLYDACCALGPVIVLAQHAVPVPEIELNLSIVRNGREVVRDATSPRHMKRTFAELIDWLGRENSFPNGVILLTGTGIVPPDDFTLEAGDVISIEATGIGILSNPVVVGPQA